LVKKLQFSVGLKTNREHKGEKSVVGIDQEIGCVGVFSIDQEKSRREQGAFAYASRDKFSVS